MIVHRSKYTMTLPRSAQLEHFKRWVEDILLSRDFLLEDGDADEFFMAPGAYLRLSDLIAASDDAGQSSQSVGTLYGIPVRSPVFIRSDLRDLEGLAEMQLEYRIIRSE